MSLTLEVHYLHACTELITGNNSLGANGSINEADGFVYLQMQLTEPALFMADDGTKPRDGITYYAANKVSGEH